MKFDLLDDIGYVKAHSAYQPSKIPIVSSCALLLDDPERLAVRDDVRVGDAARVSRFRKQDGDVGAAAKRRETT